MIKLERVVWEQVSGILSDHTMDLLLITPPLLQLNSPYPATPVLLKMLRERGFDVMQRDMSLEFALRVFTP